MFIADALTLLLDRPYALFGHCLGAVLAYEATRVLNGRGARQPVHLFTSGARAPHYGIPIANVQHMDDEQLIEHFGQVYGAPIGLLNDPEMRSRVLPMVRADAVMTQNYRYESGSLLACDITAVAGERDPDVQMEHLNGWRQHTTANVVTRLYPGDHFFFVESAAQMFDDFTRELKPQLQ